MSDQKHVILDVHVLDLGRNGGFRDRNGDAIIDDPLFAAQKIEPSQIAKVIVEQPQLFEGEYGDGHTDEFFEFPEASVCTVEERNGEVEIHCMPDEKWNDKPYEERSQYEEHHSWKDQATGRYPDDFYDD